MNMRRVAVDPQKLHRFIYDAAKDPAEFRRGLLVETDQGARPFVDVMDVWQREDFQVLDPGWRAVAGHPVRGGFQRAYLERPRGHSKTTDIAIMCAWALFASPRALDGYVAAADKDQARLDRDAIAKLVQLNPWLKSYLDVQAYRVVNPLTGSRLEILSSDAATSYGLNPDFIIIDELTHWQNRDLWDSLFSAAGKREKCMLTIISNAGFGAGEKASWQWSLREACRTDPERWHFHHLDGPVASWITQERLDEQRRILPPLVYRRVWGNEWTAGSGDAIPEDDLRAAVSLPGPLPGPEPGWVYMLGGDLGLTRDASAVAVVGIDVGCYEDDGQDEDGEEEVGTGLSHIARLMRLSHATQVPPASSVETDEKDPVYCGGTGKMKLAAVHLWRPRGSGSRIEIEPIEAAILDLHARFRLECVGLDPYQAAYLAERLRDKGVPVEHVDFTGPNLKAMASVVSEAFSQRQIGLFPHDQLLGDLSDLRIEEKSYGVRLVSPRGTNGHGDSATALSIAMLLAKKFQATWTMRARGVSGPLLCWPE